MYIMMKMMDDGRWMMDELWGGGEGRNTIKRL